jgi:fused signal recognition particle receptor
MGKDISVAKKKLSLFERLRKGLSKTREKFSSSIKSVLRMGRKLDEETMEQLVEALIAADVGPRAAERMAGNVAEAYHAGIFDNAEGALAFLKEEIKESLSTWNTAPIWNDNGPTVWLVAGVNGVGKTTTIAKLAKWCAAKGKSVLLAAGDTYRAGATDQLAIWSKRVGVDIVRHSPGGDPAAVAYDAIEATLARNIDLLIVDTAGRLHTKENLMRELEKIERVLQRKLPGAPHEVLLVLDATTGQNAVQQAKLFHQSLRLTGFVLAKLDGTAKGGIVVGMREQIDLPVKFVGIGEAAEDLEPFDAAQFVDALFG